MSTSVWAADSCTRILALTLRDDRKRERHRIDPASQSRWPPAGLNRVTEHHRDDRVLAGKQVEAGGRHPRPERARHCGRADDAGRRTRRMSSTASEAPTTAGATELENRYGRARCFSTATISRRAAT